MRLPERLLNSVTLGLFPDFFYNSYTIAARVKEELEDPLIARRVMTHGPRPEGRKPEAGDERPADVGQPHGADEASAPVAEAMEGKELARGNTDQQSAP